MNGLRISLMQTDIVWGDKQLNLHRVQASLETLCGKTDIAVLPEMFSTGFSMNTAQLAEPDTGETMTVVRRWAAGYGMALMGSYMACDGQNGTTCYNRGFFATPEGDVYYYNKRHLFRMGGESECFTAGDKHTIIRYRGWNIMLLICYDLRFPVWSRNKGNGYDVLVYVANWPRARRKVWDTLLQARAIENMAYVCGVNRVGKDMAGVCYDGGSRVYSPKGELLGWVEDGAEDIATVLLDMPALEGFRKKFPCWKDADDFHVI